MKTAVIRPNTITTKRLILREFCREDLEEIAKILSNQDVMKFALSGPYSFEETKTFLDNCLQRYARRGVGLFAVCLKVDKKVIGYCGYYFQVIDEKEEVEIGYRLDPTYWGQGFATEAAIAVKEYGFRTLGYKRMISIIESENIASIRVAEKNGMKHKKNSILMGKVPVRIYAIENPIQSIPVR